MPSKGLKDSVPLGKFGQAFRQCQKCYKAGNDVPLLSCAACHRMHYCSKECQKADWPNHKVTCRLNQDTRTIIKEKSKSGENTLNGLTIGDIESRLKKWLPMYRPLLQSTVIHALTLQSTPDLCFTHLLFVRLKPNFTASTAHTHKPEEIAQSFLVEQTFTFAIEEALEYIEVPSFRPMITRILEQSKALRSKGGLGTAIVMISVPEHRITHVSPCHIADMLSPEGLPWNFEWEEELKNMTAKGIVI